MKKFEIFLIYRKKGEYTLELWGLLGVSNKGRLMRFFAVYISVFRGYGVSLSYTSCNDDT